MPARMFGITHFTFLVALAHLSYLYGITTSVFFLPLIDVSVYRNKANVFYPPVFLIFTILHIVAILIFTKAALDCINHQAAGAAVKEKAA